ncbi:unnamed protein product, partial [Prorocentrum cordatum]
ARDVPGAELMLSRMAKDHIAADASSYSLVISACSGVREARRAEAWLRRIAAAGEDLDSEAHLLVAQVLAEVGDDGAAERSLARMRAEGLRPSAARSYSPLLSASRSKGGGDGGLERAERLLADLRAAGGTPDPAFYVELLACYAGAGAWERVDACLEEMRREGVWATANQYVALVGACARARDLPRAEALVARAIAEGVQPTVALLNAVLRACAEARQPGAAEAWLARMRERHGLDPDLQSHNLVLDACARVGNLSLAETIFQRISQVGLRPDTSSYTAVITCCGNAKRADEVPAWLAKMQEDSSLQLDAVPFNAALHACVKCEDLTRLWNSYELMHGSGVAPDAQTYLAMALFYAQCGDVERVEDFLYESRLAGHQWGEREYACLLRACGSAWPRERGRAERAFRRMVAEGVAARTGTVRYLLMAVGRVRTGELLEELGLQHLAPPPAPRRSAPRGGAAAAAADVAGRERRNSRISAGERARGAILSWRLRRRYLLYCGACTAVAAVLLLWNLQEAVSSGWQISGVSRCAWIDCLELALGAVLIAETLLTLYVMGPRSFFGSGWCVLDLCVALLTVLSIALALAALLSGRQRAYSAGMLLVVLRLLLQPARFAALCAGLLRSHRMQRDSPGGRPPACETRIRACPWARHRCLGPQPPADAFGSGRRLP